MRNVKTIATAAAAVVLCGGGGAFAMQAADGADIPSMPGKQGQTHKPGKPGRGAKPGQGTKPGQGGTSAPPARPRTAMTQQQVMDKMKGTVVRIDAPRKWDDPENPSSGSGVVIDAKQGLILTNAHVVAGASSLSAHFEGTQDDVPAQFYAQAPCSDLAIVKLASVPPTLQAAPMGASGTLKPGDPVVALGFPGGLEVHPTLNSSAGTVSKPDVKANEQGHVMPDMPEYTHTVEHTALIGHGSSGGPLFNSYGEVVGINSLGTEGQFYAIASDAIKTQLPELVKGRSHEWAGWSVVPRDEALEIYPFLDTEYLLGGIDGGLLVDGVEANSPAMAAHITEGDVVTALNGAPVNSVNDVCRILSSQPAGGTVPVRGGKLLLDQDGNAIGYRAVNNAFLKLQA
jgi:S1-C subfamily serine protease